MSRSKDYEQLPALSQSAIKDVKKEKGGWRYFYEKHIAKSFREEPTDSMELGTALHLALLEPDTFRDKVLHIPDEVLAKNGAKTTNAWKLLQAENKDRLLLKSNDFANLAYAVDAVMKHPAAAPLIAGKGITEKPITFKTNNTLCKGIPDKVIPGHAIVDVKSTCVVQPKKFQRQAEELFYDVQARFYCDGVLEVYAERLPFVFIAVEMEPPFRVRAYQAPEDWMLSGFAVINEVVQEYERRMAENDWNDVEDREFVLLEKMRWR
jgi:exodeoxyribonuclease VIII